MGGKQWEAMGSNGHNFEGGDQWEAMGSNGKQWEAMGSNGCYNFEGGDQWVGLLHWQIIVRSEVTVLTATHCSVVHACDTAHNRLGRATQTLRD